MLKVLKKIQSYYLYDSIVLATSSGTIYLGNDDWIVQVMVGFLKLDNYQMWQLHNFSVTITIYASSSCNSSRCHNLPAQYASEVWLQDFHLTEVRLSVNRVFINESVESSMKSLISLIDLL